MRVKWRIVVSFDAVFATHQLGPTYRSFSQSDCERKARGTAGRPSARWDSRRATGSANGSTSGLATALCSPIQNFGSRVVETLEALAFTSIQSWIDSKAVNRLGGRPQRRSIQGGRLCQLICSRFAISRLHRGWLFVWHCSRRPATHLPRTINAGFAPAMFSGFAHRKSRAWTVLPPACTSSGPV